MQDSPSRLRNWLSSLFVRDDGGDEEIMWRSVGLMPCEDGSTWVVQQMVGVDDDLVKPYDAHRTIHIDAAADPTPGEYEDDVPPEWTEPQQRWSQ